MSGRAYVFGDNVDTDLIVPGRFLTLSTPEELAGVCMAGLDIGFASRLQQGDVFAAGRNFGCGSSREHAPISIKAAGISCVIAISFARIFYRNAINIGLPVLESKSAAHSIREGDIVVADLQKGEIVNITQGETYLFAPFPSFIMDIIREGGLTNYIRNRSSRR